jgi:actin-related protein
MILGIHDMVIRTINCCDPNITSSLKQNIVLCGGKFYHLIYKKYMFIHLGTTLMTGFVEQMKEELLRSQTDAEIKAPHNRNSLAFIGANKLISSLEINNLWVSADDYKAAGPSIYLSKMFLNIFLFVVFIIFRSFNYCTIRKCVFFHINSIKKIISFCLMFFFFFE